MAENSPPINSKKVETAIFAGGCFWCTEADFEKVAGVYSVISGYIGGSLEDADYKKVSSGQTNHAESVQVKFNPEKISYKKLLNKFWRSIDPTAKDRQFCDTGKQYRSGIFYLNETQQKQAEASKEEILKNNPNIPHIFTEITKAEKFYPAEDYHQNFYKTNPDRYYSYRKGCGRDSTLELIWGKDKNKM